MEAYQYVKNAVLTFKLPTCCWVAPVRIGILAIAYINILISLVSLVGVANESYSPTILKVQEVILEDDASKPIPILSYATELGFNVLLLCAVYRKDTVLLRVFMYYCIITIISSALLYSIVLAVIDILTIILIITSIMFQIYLLLLVRSVIVEIKEEIAEQNGKPKLFLFSPLKKEGENDIVKTEDKVEVALESELEPVVTEEDSKKERDTKLETVEEHPNEVTIELKP